jgi:hypothetical protein
MALLFVSFQIARVRWVNDEFRKVIAVQTLLEFFGPLVFAIISLMPVGPLEIGKQDIEAWQVGGAIAALAGGAWAIKVTILGIRNQSILDSFGQKQVRLQFWVYVEYAILIVAVVAGHLPTTSGLMIWLLISGSWEAWEFFTELENETAIS